MATSFDFTIISQTEIPGMSLIVANNEDAFNYLTDEAHMDTIEDGSAPCFDFNIGDFISDSGWEKYSCELV